MEVTVRRCAGCSEVAPPTETSYTLIGTRHAWRCQKAVDADGNRTIAWYCPSCWKHRDGTQKGVESATLGLGGSGPDVGKRR